MMYVTLTWVRLCMHAVRDDDDDDDDDDDGVWKG